MGENTRPRVGVYTICKNESKFARRWLESMYCGGAGADAAFVLDTGSQDGTMKLLRRTARELGIPRGWLRLRRKVYRPFRFDTARNDNLAMTEDTDLDALVSVDMDETLIPEFWDDLRKAVTAHPDFERIYYLYAWNHDEEGKPKRLFWYNKVHPPRGCRWVHPVHEALIVEDSARAGAYYLSEDRIYLHHWPDNEKSRGSYLGLLELRAREEPDDIDGLFYLMREHLFRDAGSLRALEVAVGAYVRILEGHRDEYECLPFFALGIGDILRAHGLHADAEHFYRRAVSLGSDIRETYLKYAKMAAYQGRHELVFSLLREMEERAGEKYPTWYERDYNWTWLPEQIRAVALCWAGRYDEALEVFERAEEKYMLTPTDRREAESEGFFDDYKWLTDYLAKGAGG